MSAGRACSLPPTRLAPDSASRRVRIELDLDGAGLTRLGVELDVGKRKVLPAINNVSHCSSASCAGRVPRSPTPPTQKGIFVGNGGLAEQRFGNGRGKSVGDGEKLFSGAERAATGKDHCLFACVEDVGRAGELILTRHATRIGHEVRNVSGDIAIGAAA